jgi:hypothetical protein
MTAALKDDVLDGLAGRCNVAQFASFGPGTDPAVRHVRIKGIAVDAATDLHGAIEALLARSSNGMVNVRAFTAERPKGNPFHYGLGAVAPAVAQVRSLAGRGFFTIVNETIDVHDGGVSGVRLGNVVEFAPGGTPRVVEEPGVVSLAVDMAGRLIAIIYAATLPDVGARSRVEFSIHPNAVGLYDERTVVWEVEDDQRIADLDAHDLRPRWPNRLSEHLGDKAFGLLIADALGAPVPRTDVLARSTPPFSFGVPTGHDQRWLRTAPRRFAAGKFTTTRRWVDPFQLMAKEDPDGTAIGAVLWQDGVPARWSGAARIDADHPLVIEGVAGAGDVFMLGERPPDELPADVHEQVADVCNRLTDAIGPIRLEWAHDGQRVWVLQLNPLAGRADEERGGTVTWLDFDPLDGLDVLRVLIAQATAAGAGVRVVRPVGLTSHVGDLLRQSGIPARFGGR